MREGECLKFPAGGSSGHLAGSSVRASGGPWRCTQEQRGVSWVNHKEAGDGAICVTGEGVTVETLGLDRASAMGKSGRKECMAD